jgi:hypothetical protein
MFVMAGTRVRPSAGPSVNFMPADRLSPPCLQGLFVMPAHSALKTRVNALLLRASTTLAVRQKQDVDARHEAGHDEESGQRLAPYLLACFFGAGSGTMAMNSWDDITREYCG